MPLEPSAFFKHILCFDTYIFKRYKNRIVYFNKFIKKAKKKKNGDCLYFTLVQMVIEKVTKMIAQANALCKQIGFLPDLRNMAYESLILYEITK